MDALEAPSPPVVFGGDVTPSRRPSGHDLTRQRNALPTVFLLYSRQDEYLVGAAVFTDVYRLAQGDPDAFWLATRGVELEFPIAVTKSMCQFQSTVFMLKRDVETRIGLRCQRLVMSCWRRTILSLSRRDSDASRRTCKLVRTCLLHPVVHFTCDPRRAIS